MKRLFRIIIATILMLLRTIAFPFAIMFNFFAVRRHRSKYNRNYKKQYERFHRKDYYLPAGETRMA